LKLVETENCRRRMADRNPQKRFETMVNDRNTPTFSRFQLGRPSRRVRLVVDWRRLDSGGN